MNETELYIGDLIFFKKMNDQINMAICFNKTQFYVDVYWFDDYTVTRWTNMNQEAVLNTKKSDAWSVVRGDL